MSDAPKSFQSTESHQPVNCAQKYKLFVEQWQPKMVAELNDYQFKLVRIEGDIVWYDHPDTGEAFIVFEGELRIFSAMAR